MSSQTMAGGGATKRVLVIILAVIAVIAIVLGVLWLGGWAPSFLNSGSHVKSGHHHLYRGLVAMVVGVAAGVGAWWYNRK
ncbi:MAG: hypothetical protein ACLQFR_10245 [Streptosporangiaceae bacterium]